MRQWLALRGHRCHLSPPSAPRVAGMSPEETSAMKALLAGLPSELTLLIIEHDMDVLFDVTDQVTVLDYGTVLFEGTPDQARQSESVRGRYFGDAS